MTPTKVARPKQRRIAPVLKEWARNPWVALPPALGLLCAGLADGAHAAGYGHTAGLFSLFSTLGAVLGFMLLALGFLRA